MIEYRENGNLAEFNGYKFRLDKKTGYYLSTQVINGKRKRLHVYVWECSNGEIPTGCVIHHIDHDKSNNDISNLELLTEEEHIQRHKEEITEKQLAVWRDNLDKYARKQAIAWHKSDKGKEWHKQHYEEMKDKFYVKAEFKCLNCGKSFIATKSKENKFCSCNCRSAYRRKSGVDNIERECECCGEKFITNKYSKAKYCEKHRRKSGKIGRLCRCV